MNWGAIAIVVVYLLVTLLLPLYTAKKNTVTNTDYTVGGRHFGTLFVFFTLLSTAVPYIPSGLPKASQCSKRKSGDNMPYRNRTCCCK